MGNNVNGVDNRLLVNRPLKQGQKDGGPDKANKAGEKNTSFRKVLAEKLEEKSGVEFSRHARNRLISRDIQPGENELRKLKSAVEKAEEKGARDSLIMVDDVAYVVSVENRTVITALNGDNMRENVFTNIDSAVFM
ncbi:MAG: TIGR02530 family flagellar biosynthesis protein [Bacillota bacterium]